MSAQHQPRATAMSDKAAWYVYNRTLRAWLFVVDAKSAQWNDYDRATAFRTETAAQAALAEHSGRFVCEIMRVQA